MSIVLTISACQTGEPLTRMLWSEDSPVRIDGDPQLVKQLQRFADHGLHEWIGPREDQTLRSTMPSDPDFLPRLGAHLRQQVGSLRVSVDVK